MDAVAKQRVGLETCALKAMNSISVSQALEMALVHHRAGRLAEAEGIYRQILTAFPEQPEAMHWLGVVARQVGKLEDSLHLIEHSLERNWNDALTHSDMAQTLRDLRREQEAVKHYEIAISLRPNLFSLHNDLGIVYRHLRQHDRAIACFQEALRLGGDRGPVCMNLGGTLSDLGRLEEALAELERSLEARPGNAEAMLSMANVLLMKGDFDRGLPLYEKRLGNPEIPYPAFARPKWEGEEIGGKRLAVVSEQGLGDTIMFARYLPMLVERGGRPVLLCDAALEGLMRTMDERVEVWTNGQPAPAFDYHVPLLSLPLRMGTRLETIPGKTPYLKAQGERVEKWRKRLGVWDGSFKIAIAWAGSRRHRGDKRRSIRLEQLGGLGAVSEKATFFSVQKGPGSEEALTAPSGMNLIDLGGELHDFGDTAAVLELMDLLISVDTSVVHLAGALGRPVWNLVAMPPDWRWMLGREDTPWYPTMRLFRQDVPGDWTGAIEKVARALSQTVEAR